RLLWGQDEVQPQEDKTVRTVMVQSGQYGPLDNEWLQYMDHSVTLKACAGLNGMKIGGKVLTVVQAIPDTSEHTVVVVAAAGVGVVVVVFLDLYVCSKLSSSSETESVGGPFYGIPEHAKPLLEKPSQVLKLKNVFNQEELSVLAGPDLEETLEDIRLECARFGTVKSVNIIKEPMIAADSLQISSVDMLQSCSQDLENDSTKATAMQENLNDESCENGEAKPQKNIEEDTDETEAEKVNKIGDDEPAMSDIGHEENGAAEKVEKELTPEEPAQLGTTEDQPVCSNEDTNVQIPETGNRGSSIPEDPKPVQDGEGRQDADTLVSDTIMEKSEVVNNDTQKTCDQDQFEKGCILVEYLRSEAACAAAHSLHGRLYGNQTVATEYDFRQHRIQAKPFATAVLSSMANPMLLCSLTSLAVRFSADQLRPTKSTLHAYAENVFTASDFFFKYPLVGAFLPRLGTQPSLPLHSPAKPSLDIATEVALAIALLPLAVGEYFFAGKIGAGSIDGFMEGRGGIFDLASTAQGEMRMEMKVEKNVVVVFDDETRGLQSRRGDAVLTSGMDRSLNVNGRRWWHKDGTNGYNSCYN
ncbi:hypothetical protein ACLOJK_007895, partial [Asimina triloba]